MVKQRLFYCEKGEREEETLKKVSNILSLAIIALLCMEMLLAAAPAHAVDPTTMEILNPLDGTHDFNFTTAQKNVGDKFSININVTNVVDLAGWQMAIAWDPTLLQYSSMIIPTNNIFAGESLLKAGPDVSVPGLVVYGAILPPGGHGVNGSGILAQLNLTIIKAVSSEGPRLVQCNISFQNIGGDTFLLDSVGGVLVFTPIDGYYAYSAPPPPPAHLYMDPPKVVDPALTPGNVFNVSLNVANATKVGSWSASIFYNSSLLNATNVEEGEFLKSVNTTNFEFVTIEGFNSTHGMIQMNCSLSSGGRSGNGILSIISFEVLDFGESAIAISDISLEDPFGEPLSFSMSDGYFNNILLAKLSIDPYLITGPSYLPGTTFTVNVTLSDIENLKTCIFNLTCAPLVIQEINIATPSVLGQTPIKRLQVDDAAGYVWANLTYRTGITTLTHVTIMTIEFQVLAMGVSPIDLTDTQLIDTSNNPIVHEVHNGIFIGLIRDVAITDLLTDLPIAYQGWSVYVNVWVQNKGNVTETFDVSFYYDSNLGGSSTVIGLVPDEERTVTTIWNTSTVQPCHNYSISATAGPVPFEMNLADNNFTDGNVKIRLMGDVNGDGKVDMRDIAQLVEVFRTYPGKPGWDPLNDLDRNGLNDMRDIVICILNFGKSCL
jgi:hypothetical protein